MPKPDELITAAALRAKATKALDTMRARIVKAPCGWRITTQPAIR